MTTKFTGIVIEIDNKIKDAKVQCDDIVVFIPKELITFQIRIGDMIEGEYYDFAGQGKPVADWIKLLN